MNQNLKTVAQISFKTGVKWFFMVSIGIVLTIICLTISLFNNSDWAGSGHGSFITLSIGLFTTNFFAFLLIFGSPIFITIYILLANKISIHNTLFLIWKSKAGIYIIQSVKTLTSKITEGNNWRQQISDSGMAKMKLLQATKESQQSSKLQKKVIGYGLKKIKLDDIDFQQENLNLSDIISNKFESFLDEFTKPSFKLFWLLVVIHLLILALSNIP